MEQQRLAGVYPILATPFDDSGALDAASLRRLVDFQMSIGVQGVTACGMAGEVHKLSDAERTRVVEIVVEAVAGRGIVIAGTGHSGTDVTVELSRQAEAAGADALMVQPPYVFKPDPAGIVEHYRAVAGAVSLPIIVQDEPVVTGLTMAPGLLAQLGRDIPNVHYVKVEHVPTAIKMSRIVEAAAAAGSEPPGLLGGMGGLYFLDELRRGAVGIMTGFAYPEVLVEVYTAFAAGERERAAEVFYRYLPLIVFEGQLGVSGVAIRKAILQLRGLIASAHVRAPRGPAIDRQTWQETRALIERLGLPLGAPPGGV